MEIKQFLNKNLHRIHLYIDAMIGIVALITIFIPETLSTFIKVDVVFHIFVFALAFINITLEKVLHKHKGIIVE
jgi:hypothetical protein